MENFNVIITTLLGLLVILQFTSLIKITQIQNGQKHQNREVKGHSAGDNKARPQNQNNQNPNKKNRGNGGGGNSGNQNNNNNNSAQQQNQKVSPPVSEKKFERIVSSAQSLKDTNSQLGNRTKENKNFNQQQNKPKVYSERTVVQKQERPANVPIKQSESIKPERPERSEQEKPNTAQIEKPIVEVKETSGSVQYGRR